MLMVGSSYGRWGKLLYFILYLKLWNIIMDFIIAIMCNDVAFQMILSGSKTIISQPKASGLNN